MMSKNDKILLWVVIILAIIAIWIYCSKKQENLVVSANNIPNVVNQIKTELQNSNCDAESTAALNNWLSCFSQNNIDNCTLSACANTALKKVTTSDKTNITYCLGKNANPLLNSLGDFQQNYKCYTPTQTNNYKNCINNSGIITALNQLNSNYTTALNNNNNTQISQELNTFINNFVTCESEMIYNLLDKNAQDNYKNCMSKVPCESDCKNLFYTLQQNNTSIQNDVNNLNNLMSAVNKCYNNP